MRKVTPTLFVLSFLLLLNRGVFAQRSDYRVKNDTGGLYYDTPFYKANSYNNWAIKGKIFPFVFGNDGGFNILAGTEFGFCRNHTLGMDAYFLREGGSHDEVQDTAGVKHDVGDSHHRNEGALFFNYRYYFDTPGLRDEKGISMYIQLFFRYGKLHDYEDPLFTKTFISNDEIHYSGGPGFGLIFNIRKRLGWDVHVDPFYKQKMVTEVTRVNGQPVTTITHPTQWGVRVGVNLIYWFYYGEKR